MPCVTCGTVIKTCVAVALVCGAVGVAASAILTSSSQSSSSQSASTSVGTCPANSSTAASNAASSSTTNCAAGNFDVAVAGVYAGHGSATVSSGSVQITAPITDAQGNAGTFAATITIVNGHFNGTGMAMGAAVTLVGRVDAPDAATQNPILRVSRLVGTFTTAAGLHGRVAGQWTTQAQATGSDGGSANNGGTTDSGASGNNGGDSGDGDDGRSNH
ncbi:MAG TPA: hypothetical protein VFE47_04150 [Tepidisphaeraceae bacterium]|jgi:hypothetical protein|nr:hypothetical protein [Tepidisphaeraceae bacterium]